MGIYKPKTIEEAINQLQKFLMSDLYSKFIPKIKIDGETLYRDDYFKTKKDFYCYMDAHFRILKKHIKEINFNICQQKSSSGEKLIEGVSLSRLNPIQTTETPNEVSTDNSRTVHSADNPNFKSNGDSF